jgi:type II secretion system protein N
MGVGIRGIVVQILAYTLYALVAFVIFVYAFFPYDLLQQRLMEWVSRDGRQLVLTRLRPMFPPGLRAEGIRLHVDQFSLSDATMSIETLRVYPEWFALLARTIQVHFEAGLYNGQLEGEARYTKGESGPLWEVRTRFLNLDMTQYALWRKDGKAFIRGRLGGDANATLTRDGHMHDSSLNLRVQAAALVGIPGWPLQLPREIICDTLLGELKTPAKQASTVALTCQGKDLFIDGRGTVAWKAPLADSQLNVRWQVRSEEAYKQELTFLANRVRKRPDRRGEISFRLQGPLHKLETGA